MIDLHVFPDPSLAVVIPVFNEEVVIDEFVGQLRAAHNKFPENLHVCYLFVNNGSTDGTLGELLRHWDNQMHLEVISLSRNFGYEAGIIAGLASIQSDFYAVIDGDGEDPVDLLPSFYLEILQGADVVQGLRLMRNESKSLQTFRRFSYLFLSKISDEPFRINVGNFSMFRKNIRNGIIEENKVFPFMRATLSRIGYKVVEKPHNRSPRIGGVSNYRKVALVKFAILGFLTSTTWPLRFSLYMGVFMAVITSLVLNLYFFGVISDHSFDVIQLIFSSFLLYSIGVASIYIARVYKFIIGRPMYYFDTSKNFSRNSIIQE
jgi:glycosyltransferase involved in cell wall biosynthesis